MAAPGDDTSWSPYASRGSGMTRSTDPSTPHLWVNYRVAYIDHGFFNFKFAANGTWDIQWGRDPDRPGYVKRNGDDLIGYITSSGLWKITVNLETLEYSLTKATQNDFGSYEEFKRTYNLVLGESGDDDEDGLTNMQEYLLNTDPNNTDSDNDGVTDGAEVSASTNPLIDENFPNSIRSLIAHPVFDYGGRVGGINMIKSTNPTTPNLWLSNWIKVDNARDLSFQFCANSAPRGGDPYLNLELYWGADPDRPGYGKFGSPQKYIIQKTSAGLYRFTFDVISLQYSLVRATPSDMSYGTYQNYFSPLGGENDDDDNDGLTNMEEFILGTHPKNPDSDADGINDGVEVSSSTNPFLNETGSSSSIT